MLEELELLKIELMAKGMTVSESARRAIEGDKKRPLTLADYASTSGISLELPERIWANAPIQDFNPNFVGEGTQHILDFRDGVFYVRNGQLEVEAKPVPVPEYHDKANSKGEKYTNFSITHTDRVRASPLEGCSNNCKFCDMPLKYDYRTKTPEDIVDSIGVALDDVILPARHIMLSGGTPKPEDYDYLNGVYDAVAQSFPGISFDVMMTPIPDLLDLRRLRGVGINGLSINMELYNEDIAREIMPGKHEISRQGYLDFIKQAVDVFGIGKVRSLLMLGLEPLEDTLKGVEELAVRGCDPVLSPFRPDPSTPLADKLPPTIEFMAEAYERARDIVSKHNGVVMGPRCIPCHHNTLTFPDDSGEYFYS